MTRPFKAHPEIPREIAMGEFSTLHQWLRAHVYQHGRKFRPDELVERATGSEMNIGSYLSYLRNKYGELYRLQKYLTQNKTVRPTAEYSCRKPHWRAKRHVLGDTHGHRRICGISRTAHAVPPGPQMTFKSACRLSFFTTDIARFSAPGSDDGSSTRSP